ncbi:RHS repeat-associated core domain-containing protein [Chromobacterium sp. CV08]|uniref:RHS repeat-associated core domain-containing protein n=1 Tax=Chromobacterium sp. CV08 TaxID=3133274 RepID=UPI003DAA0BC5
MNECVLSCNGERRDPLGGAAHLGNGYRAYSPALMRFHCPDSLSPFGAGGINAYGYCAGDPVNRADPSGHLSWQAWTGIGLGVAGLVLAAISAASAIVAAGGVIAAIESASAIALGVVADVTAIACGAIEESHPQASAILGWVSLGAGAAGVGYGVFRLGRRVAGLLGGRDRFRMTLGLDDEFETPAILGMGQKTEVRARPLPYRVTRNKGMPKNVAYKFRDTTADGKRRLNIVAHHVDMNPPEPLGRLQIGTGQYPVDIMPSFFKYRGIDLTDYSVVRFISCHSAGMAEWFARKTGMVTVGYRDLVSIYGRASDFAHAAMDDIFRNSPDGDLGRMNVEFRQRYDDYAKAFANERDTGIAFYRVEGDEVVFGRDRDNGAA